MSVPVTTVSERLATKPVYGESGYVTFSNTSRLEVADSPELSITGDLTLVVRAKLDGLASSGQFRLVGKGSPVADYALSVLTPSNQVQFSWSEGGGPLVAVLDDVSPYLDADGWVYLAATLDVDPGVGRVYTSPDGYEWTLGGEFDNGAVTSINDSSANLAIFSGIDSPDTPSVSFVSVNDGVKDGPSGSEGLPGGVPVLLWSGFSVEDASDPLVAYTAQTLTQIGTPVITPVDSVRGVQVGSGDWRMIVERLEGEAEGGEIAVVGVSVVGTIADDGSGHQVGALQWADFTDKVRGMNWARGADEQNGRPRIGEISVTVDCSDHENDPFSNYAKTRPGTILRTGVVSASDIRGGGWLPQWCGLVDQWPVAYVPSVNHVADSYGDVTLVETLSSLARLDGNATSSAGAGETVVTRVDRLLTAASWQFGRVVALDEGEPPFTLQSTDMSLNRLAELYLTADSTTTVVRSDVTGAAIVTSFQDLSSSRLVDFSSSSGQPFFVLTALDHDTDDETWFLGYNVDTLEPANDPQGVVNDHRYARVGGTQQLVEHSVSIGRFKMRSTRARGDLICQSDVVVLNIAQTDNSREALTALRVENVEVVATAEPDVLLAVAAIDHDEQVMFIPPTDDTKWAMGRIRALSHEIGAMDGTRVDWRASYAIDFLQSNVPGAVLDI